MSVSTTTGIILFYTIFSFIGGFFSVNGIVANIDTNQTQLNQSIMSDLVEDEPSTFDAIGFVVEFAIETLKLFLRMTTLSVPFTMNFAVNTFINFFCF